jgi:hypothetical protein
MAKEHVAHPTISSTHRAKNRSTKEVRMEGWQPRANLAPSELRKWSGIRAPTLFQYAEGNTDGCEILPAVICTRSNSLR